MPKNIIFIGARLSDNFGGPSLANSTVELFLTLYPDSRFTLLVPEQTYKKDRKMESRYPFEILPFHPDKILFFSIIKKITNITFGSYSIKKTVTALYQADFLIDIWGIMFTDTLRSFSFIPKLREGFRLVLGRLFNKPFIKYTSAMGPFNAKWNRIFAKYYLNNFVHAIYARDDVTRYHLNSIGIKPPIFIVPDTAFLLPSTPINLTYLSDFLNVRKVLGISVSYQVRNRFHIPEKYISLIVSFIRYVVHQYQINVLLIPNELEDGSDDDKIIAQEIESAVNISKCKMLDTSNLTASETKGMIDYCDLLVASRYHTVVAGLSMGIPTISIGWHHKYKEVLKLFNQSQWCFEIANMNLDLLKTKFAKLYKEEDIIQKEIISYIPKVKQDIILSLKNIQFILENT